MHPLSHTHGYSWGLRQSDANIKFLSARKTVSKHSSGIHVACPTGDDIDEFASGVREAVKIRAFIDSIEALLLTYIRDHGDDAEAHWSVLQNVMDAIKEVCPEEEDE